MIWRRGLGVQHQPNAPVKSIDLCYQNSTISKADKIVSAVGLAVCIVRKGRSLRQAVPCASTQIPLVDGY